MSSVGTTTIVASGDAGQRKTLVSLAASSASGDDKHFTLAALLKSDETSDNRCWWTHLEHDQDKVTLAIGMAYNDNCFGLARILSEQFCDLAFHSWFQRECEVEEALAMGHRNGIEIYRENFGPLVTSVEEPDNPNQGCFIRYHLRSEGSDLAALHHLYGSLLDRIAAGRPGIGGWYSTPQSEYADMLYRPCVDTGEGTVLLVEDDRILLLDQVNAHGGYRQQRVVTLAELHDLHFETCGEVANIQSGRRASLSLCDSRSLTDTSPDGDLYDELDF